MNDNLERVLRKILRAESAFDPREIVTADPEIICKSITTRDDDGDETELVIAIKVDNSEVKVAVVSDQAHVAFRPEELAILEDFIEDIGLGKLERTGEPKFYRSKTDTNLWAVGYHLGDHNKKTEFCLVYPSTKAQDQSNACYPGLVAKALLDIKYIKEENEWALLLNRKGHSVQVISDDPSQMEFRKTCKEVLERTSAKNKSKGAEQ